MNPDPLEYTIADKMLDRMHRVGALVVAVRKLLQTWDASTEDGHQSPRQRWARLSNAVETLREIVRGL